MGTQYLDLRSVIETSGIPLYPGAADAYGNCGSEAASRGRPRLSIVERDNPLRGSADGVLGSGHGWHLNLSRVSDPQADLPQGL